MKDQQPKELNYKPNETIIVDGERSQKAIENTIPKNSVVNTISVDEVKDIAKEAQEEATELTPAEKAWIRDMMKKSLVAVHDFAEGTVLTNAILEQVKSGDIVKMANMEFVVNNKVNQTPRSITGQIVGVATESSLSIIKLDWVKGQELEPTTVTYTFETQNEQEE